MAKQGFRYALPPVCNSSRKGKSGSPISRKSNFQSPKRKGWPGATCKAEAHVESGKSKNSRTSSRENLQLVLRQGRLFGSCRKMRKHMFMQASLKKTGSPTFSQTTQTVGSLGGVPYCSANRATAIFNSVVLWLRWKFRWQARRPCIQCEQGSTLGQKRCKHPSQSFGQLLRITCRQPTIESTIGKSQASKVQMGMRRMVTAQANRQNVRSI